MTHQKCVAVYSSAETPPSAGIFSLSVMETFMGVSGEVGADGRLYAAGIEKNANIASKMANESESGVGLVLSNSRARVFTDSNRPYFIAYL